MALQPPDVNRLHTTQSRQIPAACKAAHKTAVFCRYSFDPLHTLRAHMQSPPRQTYTHHTKSSSESNACRLKKHKTQCLVQATT